MKTFEYMKVDASLRFRFLGLLIFFASSPFLLYYTFLIGIFAVDYLASFLPSAANMPSLSLTPPEHWLWYGASACLAGAVIIFWLRQEIAYSRDSSYEGTQRPS